jgi:hypothetical protein
MAAARWNDHLSNFGLHGRTFVATSRLFSLLPAGRPAFVMRHAKVSAFSISKPTSDVIDQPDVPPRQVLNAVGTSFVCRSEIGVWIATVTPVYNCSHLLIDVVLLQSVSVVVAPLRGTLETF